jgi:propanol-preferring alcohol dehydrogenase
MKAMVLPRIVSLDEVPAPLECVEMPVPEPGPGQVLIRVSACGVCHTELDEIEGRAPPPILPVVLGHEVVGRVVGRGAAATKLNLGDRVGVGWIHSSTGRRDENLSPAFRATGRDAHGGYAEYMVAAEDHAHRLPKVFSDPQAAPLLCAGAIGHRALNLARIRDGDRLGLTGFGASAHLTLQLARHRYPNTPVHVFAREPAARQFALQSGAVWTGATADHPPQPLHAIIDTTPAWTPVVAALANLRPGGRLVINAIRKEDVDRHALMQLRYHEHLWMEKQIQSVANITRFDIAEYLPLAAQIPIKPQVQTYRLDEANRALLELKRGGAKGAKVLVVG